MLQTRELQLSWLCTYSNLFFADYENCTSENDKFQCDNGVCIDYAYYDEGHNDCGDFSDEPIGKPQ